MNLQKYLMKNILILDFISVIIGIYYLCIFFIERFCMYETVKE